MTSVKGVCRLEWNVLNSELLKVLSAHVGAYQGLNALILFFHYGE